MISNNNGFHLVWYGIVNRKQKTVLELVVLPVTTIVTIVILQCTNGEKNKIYRQKVVYNLHTAK